MQQLLKRSDEGSIGRYERNDIIRDIFTRLLIPVSLILERQRATVAAYVRSSSFILAAEAMDSLERCWVAFLTQAPSEQLQIRA